ncbi:hypothetical protein M3P21_22120 [Ruegeria sp. 2012CJ41-6]|uniref:Uncharacterized protein n=1 Tax=Ruegeria spongiae TaxID=2942209 RepID=A0ABT0Q8I4_9RHOB|nr:hypothetical protein [Ruegeria spongiae]MCL6286193.1 hypothetical protein [Ruegeria spongiae]
MAIKALRNVAKAVNRIFGEPAIRVRFDTDTEEPVSVIFQESYADFDIDGVQVSNRQPTAWIHDTVNIDSRDLLRYGGVDYRISYLEPDGYGLVRLYLELD